MSIFTHIDRDKIVGFLAFYWWVPLRYWTMGIDEEVFFLHDFFRHHRMHGHDLDVGMKTSARLTHSVAQLHQRGPKRTDQFGSDFAITIDIQGAVTLRKTALFQTKLAANYSVDVEYSQLEQATAVPQFAGKCFTMAIDRSRVVLRIESVETLASTFKKGQASKRFDTTTWVPSSDWVTNWFECRAGLPSSIGGIDQIEDLLATHVIERSDGFPEFNEGENRGLTDRRSLACCALPT